MTGKFRSSRGTAVALDNAATPDMAASGTDGSAEIRLTPRAISWPTSDAEVPTSTAVAVVFVSSRVVDSAGEHISGGVVSTANACVQSVAKVFKRAIEHGTLEAIRTLASSVARCSALDCACAIAHPT